MKKRSLPKTPKREKVIRESDPIPWKYCLLTLVCGSVLVAGFFLAARSHFTSINFGIKNSDLKKQLDELQAEKRRLILSKEMALAPAEIKKAAKKLGLTEMTASNIVSFQSDENKKVTDTAATQAKSGPAKNTEDPKPSVVAADNFDRKPEKEPKDTIKPAETKDKKFSKTGK